jgi:hypothetical protein
MSLTELANRATWFEELAAIYDHHNMGDTAKRFRLMAAEYRAEMERRPDTAE